MSLQGFESELLVHNMYTAYLVIQYCNGYWPNDFYLSDVLTVNLLGSALTPPMILGGPFLVGPPLELGLFVCLLFSVFVSRYPT